MPIPQRVQGGNTPRKRPKAVGGAAIFPQFKRNEKGRDFTDFADVARSRQAGEGLDVVRWQVEQGFARLLARQQDSGRDGKGMDRGSQRQQPQSGQQGKRRPTPGPGTRALNIPSACSAGAGKGNRMGRYGVAVTGLAMGAILLYASIENCGWVLGAKPAAYCGDLAVARVVQLLGAGESVAAVGALVLTWLGTDVVCRSCYDKVAVRFHRRLTSAPALGA